MKWIGYLDKKLSCCSPIRPSCSACVHEYCMHMRWSGGLPINWINNCNLTCVVMKTVCLSEGRNDGWSVRGKNNNNNDSNWLYDFFLAACLRYKCNDHLEETKMNRGPCQGQQPPVDWDEASFFNSSFLLAVVMQVHDFHRFKLIVIFVRYFSAHRAVIFD